MVVVETLAGTGAAFSRCAAYRYRLWRTWDARKSVLGFVMLNPSTADELDNDPTVARCQRRAERLGYGGLVVANAYALRSTDPQALYAAGDPIGPDNDQAIRQVATEAALVICGWGVHADQVQPGRGTQVLDMIQAAGRTPHVLGVNADGSPQHPLYLAYNVQPRPIDELHREAAT